MKQKYLHVAIQCLSRLCCFFLLYKGGTVLTYGAHKRSNMVSFEQEVIKFFLAWAAWPTCCYNDCREPRPTRSPAVIKLTVTSVMGSSLPLTAL
jgi:hypothetical protein